MTGLDQLQVRQLAIAVIGGLLGLLLSVVDGTIVDTTMPRVTADLGGLEQYAWVATVYLLGSTAAVPIFGKLSDLDGRKWLYIGGLLLFMLATALCGLSQSMIQLIAFRGLQGVACGTLAANSFAIIGDIFPPRECGKWQGVIGASATGSGTVMTPMMIALVGASTLGGQVIPRICRSKWASLSGLALMTVGLWLLTQMGAEASRGDVITNLVVQGVGLGLVMPTFTLAVQKAFPAKNLGAVTAAQFFRSIGSTIGVALMGTFLTMRLTSGLADGVPLKVAQEPPESEATAVDPQALINPEMTHAFEAQFAVLPEGSRLFAELMGALRLALAT